MASKPLRKTSSRLVAQSSSVRSARQRILDVAIPLFYHEGARAVGIDTIIAKSGVAKMSLYRSFRSKDELIAACLEERDKSYWQWFDGVVAQHPGDPREQLRGVIRGLFDVNVEIDQLVGSWLTFDQSERSSLGSSNSVLGGTLLVGAASFSVQDKIRVRLIVKDMVCYRRHGHNEGDDPKFTQPHLYALIDKHPNPREVYTQFLMENGEPDAKDLAKDLAKNLAKKPARRRSIARPVDHAKASVAAP